MHGDVNSRLYVRSAREEKVEKEEEEEDEERQTTLEDINHPMATLASAHISDTQYARLWMSIDVEIPHPYSQHARTRPRDSEGRFARSSVPEPVPVSRQEQRILTGSTERKRIFQ